MNEFSNAKTAELTFPVCEKRMSFVYERLSCWPGGYFNNNFTDGYPDYYMNISSMVNKLKLIPIDYVTLDLIGDISTFTKLEMSSYQFVASS